MVRTLHEPNTRDPIIARVRGAVDQTVAEFIANPFDFLYESDLRSVLYYFARQALEDSRVPLRVRDPRAGTTSDLTITRVRSEYPSELTPRQRFDIAILPDVLGPSKNRWCQPVRAAVELKLWQVDGTGGWMERDRSKLTGYLETCRAAQRPFCGIGLVFVHPGAEWRIAEFASLRTGADFPENGCAIHIVTRTERFGVRSPGSAGGGELT